MGILPVNSKRDRVELSTGQKRKTCHYKMEHSKKNSTSVAICHLRRVLLLAGQQSVIFSIKNTVRTCYDIYMFVTPGVSIYFNEQLHTYHSHIHLHIGIQP